MRKPKNKDRPNTRLTPKQAAELVGCTSGYIRMLLRNGKLRGTAYPDPDRPDRMRYLIPLSEANRLLDLFDPARGFPRGAKRDGIRGPKVA